MPGNGLLKQQQLSLSLFSVAIFGRKKKEGSLRHVFLQENSVPMPCMHACMAEGKEENLSFLLDRGFEKKREAGRLQGGRWNRLGGGGGDFSRGRLENLTPSLSIFLHTRTANHEKREFYRVEASVWVVFHTGEKGGGGGSPGRRQLTIHP